MTVKAEAPRVLGVQVVCDQCPRRWWMRLVPAAVRPRAWHPRRLAGLTWTPAQGDWTAMQEAEALALAEIADRENEKVIARHRRWFWRRFHFPSTEMITEKRPATAGATYAAPFEYPGRPARPGGTS